MRNPDLIDVHAIALDSGAAYVQEAGCAVGAYVFSPESLSALMVKIALRASEGMPQLQGVRT